MKYGPLTTTPRRIAPYLAAAAIFLGATAVARADAIDGDWCSPEGKHLSIRGPAITTPGGVKMSGNYSRHAFSSVAPEKEANAGVTIFMSLMSETTVQVREGTPVAQPIVWKRCENVT